MDYSVISCGVIGQTGTLPAGAQGKIHASIGKLFKTGLRRFLIAVTGRAAAVFAETALTFREQYPDMGIDVLIPFDGWIDDQPNGARYRRITAQAESVNYSCDEDYGNSTDICDTQLIGYGRCTVFIHGGGDERIRKMIKDARDAGQDIKEIII